MQSQVERRLEGKCTPSDQSDQNETETSDMIENNVRRWLEKIFHSVTATGEIKPLWRRQC